MSIAPAVKCSSSLVQSIIIARTSISVQMEMFQERVRELYKDTPPLLCYH